MNKTNEINSRGTLIHDVRKFNFGWRMWFWLLMIVNLVAPIFFLKHPEAWGVLGTYVLAAAVIIPLHRRLGWVRLLGIGHFPWFVLLPWLYSRMMTTAIPNAMWMWLVTVIVVNTICLIIDIVDLFRYARGERAPIV
jgi:hypothetical protein